MSAKETRRRNGGDTGDGVVVEVNGEGGIVIRLPNGDGWKEPGVWTEMMDATNKHDRENTPILHPQSNPTPQPCLQTSTPKRMKPN